MNDNTFHSDNEKARDTHSSFPSQRTESQAGVGILMHYSTHVSRSNPQGPNNTIMQVHIKPETRVRHKSVTTQRLHQGGTGRRAKGRETGRRGRTQSSSRTRGIRQGEKSCCIGKTKRQQQKEEEEEDVPPLVWPCRSQNRERAR